MQTSSDSRSTQQLVEFVALVSGAMDEQDAIQRAVERTAEAFEAEVCALVRDGGVPAAIGFPAGYLPERTLVEAVEQRLDRLSLEEFGDLDVVSVALEDEARTALLVGRLGCDGFSQQEADLLRGIARVLALTMRVVQTLDEERELRRQSQHEIRQRKLAERLLAHQALHDRLTGLPNRSLLRDRTVHALERARGGDSFVATLFIDLDHFKVTNDALGHSRGDELLALFAQRLQSILHAMEDHSATYTLARHGGDEFMVLCEDLSSERDAITLAERIQAGLRKPFSLYGQAVTLSASIGVAVAGCQPDAPDADGLLRDADVAMSRAKERGRDCYELFDEQMRIRLLDRVQLEADLRAGIERDELQLVYQPLVAVSDGSLVAVEALVRWEHPTRGLLPPAEFISLAEESELIVSLGSWVIEEACRQIRRWREAHPAELNVRVSVNVSPRQLSPALVEIVAGALKRNGIEPSQLALEITESLLIEQTESPSGILVALRELGVGIVLDDFGTGYSSLSYLRGIPLDQLKLDRSFISELVEDPRSPKIVSATIEMARALGMTIVAEGVETTEQLEVLQRLRCDYAQGYLFAKPEGPDQIFARVRAAFERDRELAEHYSAPAAEAIGAAATTAEPSEQDTERQVALGRMTAALFTIGGVLAIPADLVIHAPNLLNVVLLSLMGVLSGLVCFCIPWGRISARWLHVAAIVGTVEVSISVRVVGPHATVLMPYYVLIAVAVAYAFQDRRAILAQVLFICALMALPLTYLHSQPQDTAARILVAIPVLAVTAAIVVYLRERMDLSHAELRELAVRDPLTNIGNYRLLHERLDYELLRHQRDENQLAVLLIDLDRFKQVNERLGHAAGDDVLRRVARTLREVVRQQDTVARQGGDEFAVLAPNTDAEGAGMLAARVRDRLGRLQFAGDAVGATVGIAVYPADGLSPQALLARADSNLLAGKTRAVPGAVRVEPAAPWSPAPPKVLPVAVKAQ